MRQMTRTELFDAIWDRPMSTVASELGVSSTVLKSLCDRHSVPTPRTGHWSKVAVGRPPAKPALPAVSSELETLKIGAAQKPQRPAKLAQAHLAQSPTADTGRTDVADNAPVTLASEQPAIAALRKAILRAKPDASGFHRMNGKGLIPLVVGEDSIERALTWLTTFLAEAEGLGHSLDRSSEAACLVVSGERIPFRIEEKPKRTPHVPTAKELAEKARRADWGYSASWTPWPKYDHGPSGLLSLVIDANSYSGLRKTFSDGKTQSLETMSADILGSFAAHAALIVENRLKADEARRQAEIARMRRDRQKAFELREGRRSKFVDLVAEALEERTRIQSVLDHLENASANGQTAPSGMEVWLRRRLAEIDALVSLQFLNLSARSAKIDFDEGRAVAAEPEPAWYYPRPVELQFWSIDEASDQATSQTTLKWMIDTGLVPDPAVDHSA